MIHPKSLLIISYLVVTNFTFAQSNNDLPKNVVTLQGKQYIIHIVKRGETLYGISRQYNVPYDTVLKYNQFLLPSSLDVGETVKIPLLNIQETTKQVLQQDKASNRYHTVVQGETLYRISVNYGVKVSDLIQLNPDATNGIHPGQKIFLPDNTPTPVVIQQDQLFIYHTVEQDETAEKIAQKYGIKVKDLAKSNKDLKLNQLSTGQKVKIPKKNVEVTYHLSADTIENWQHHKVQPKETLYSISKKYNVEIEEIKKLNPALNQRELLAGEIIKIPIKAEQTLSSEESISKPHVSDIQIEIKPTATPTCPCRPMPQKSYKIGILLPFFTNFLNDSIDNVQIPARSRQFIEFYQGALLALNDLKSLGLNAELYVFDTQNNTSKTQAICESAEFNDLDLIIGPVFGRNIEIVAQAAKKNQIPIVSPLSTEESFLANNPYAFMVTPTQKIINEHIVNSILKLNSSNFIVILDVLQQDSMFVPQLKRKLYTQYSAKNIHNLRYTEFTYFKGQETKLLELFEGSDTTVVIIPSNDEAFVSDLVGRLNTLSNQKTIILVGQPRWLRFDNVKLEFLHNLNSRLFSISNPDYRKINVVKFVKSYRTYFGTEPTQRSFEGYDITRYFAEALLRYGREFRCCLSEYNPELLNLVFQFQSIDASSGYANHKLYLVEYTKQWDRKFTILK